MGTTCLPITLYPAFSADRTPLKVIYYITEVFRREKCEIYFNEIIDSIPFCLIIPFSKNSKIFIQISVIINAGIRKPTCIHYFFEIVRIDNCNIITDFTSVNIPNPVS